MKRLLQVAVPAALLCVFAGSARPAAQENASQIIEKAIESAGGAKNLRKLRASTWSEKGTYYGMETLLPYTGKFAAEFPKKFRMEIEGIFVMVISGKEGWVKAGDMVSKMGKKDLKIQRTNHRAGFLSSLIPLAGKGSKKFELKAIGEAKVKDNVAVGVEVARKGYPTVKMYFDKESGLLVKFTYKNRVKENNYKLSTMDNYLSDYKKVDAVQFPMKMSILVDGKKFIEAEITDVTLTKKLDAKLFVKPKP